MCVYRKQKLITVAYALIGAVLIIAFGMNDIHAQSWVNDEGIAPSVTPDASKTDPITDEAKANGAQANRAHANGASASSIVAGRSHGGIINELYVTVPPSWSYQVERVSGSFVDCGSGVSEHAGDPNGRGQIRLSCGVTLTETLVIPAASQSAKFVIHH